MPLLTRLLLVATLATFASAFSAPPSWDQLRAAPALSKPSPPIYQDSLPDGAMQQRKPILYRDKDCICAASQSVWLAMECKNVDYLTVLVSKEEDEAVPRIVWPKDDDDDDDNNNNEAETDPIKLIEQIQKRHPETLPQFYPKISLAVDASRCQILRLPGVMPRNSDPSWMSHAPFLFRSDGTKVARSSHCVSLEEVEEMQEEYYLGSYLCGRDVCAADMVWAPYLERYAIQLPLLFPLFRTCNPRSKSYEEVAAWYKTMETKLPQYACCVQGDARLWRKTLEYTIGLHNERAVSEEEKVTYLPPVSEEFGWWLTKNPRGKELWKEYANTELRPWLGDTPEGEVALHLMRNSERIVALARVVDSGLDDMSRDDADEALRELIQLLVDGTESGGAEGLSKNARHIAKFLSEEISVPKDLGMIPALALGELVKSLQ